METPGVNLDQEEDAQMEVDEGPDGINGEVSVHDCSRVRGQNVLLRYRNKSTLTDGYEVCVAKRGKIDNEFY